MLNDYNANVPDMISRLLADEVKEKYNKKVKYATKVELKTARENVWKKTSAALLLIRNNHGRDSK